MVEAKPPDYTIVATPVSHAEPDELLADERSHRPDDMMVLRVEDENMTVPTRWLKKNSRRFKKIADTSAEVNDEHHPLVVPDVTVAQFEALLDYIENSTSGNFSMPATRWVHLLRAASHHLEITSIKGRVTREVFYNHRDSFRLVDLMSFYEAYAVGRENLRNTMRQFIVRSPGALSADELKEMTSESAARIIAMREEYLYSLSQPFGAWNAPKKADSLADTWVRNG